MAQATYDIFINLISTPQSGRWGERVLIGNINQLLGNSIDEFTHFLDKTNTLQSVLKF
jgi:hypothetical protein